MNVHFIELMSNHKHKMEKKTKPKTRMNLLTAEQAGKVIDKWNVRLAERNVAFRDSREELIQELIKFEYMLINFKTYFKRTDIEYVHPKLVCVVNVINGYTKIWTKEEKNKKVSDDAQKNTPRGVDTNGNKETGRAHGVFDLCLKLKAKYEFHATVRGSLVDIIGMISKLEGIGFQIATSDGGLNNWFTFAKTIIEIIYCLLHNLIVILIGVKGDAIIGVYIFFPTSKTIAELDKFKPTMRVQAKIAHKKSSSDFTKFLNEHRYLMDEYSTDVAGVFKPFAQFETDMIDFIEKNYSQIVQDPFHLRSLFTDSTHRCEWAANVLYEQLITEKLGMTMTSIHGQRGDFLLEHNNNNSSDTIRNVVEHKVVQLNSCSKGKSQEWKSLVIPMRHIGHQGMNPEIVNLVVGFLRKYWNGITPIEPDDFTAFIVWPVVTLDGDPGLRPDDPTAYWLCFNWETNSEYIRIAKNKIGTNLFPAHLTREGPVIRNQPTIEVKSVFFYDKMSDERIEELFELMAHRPVNKSAIDAYKNAVTDELIEKERKSITKKN